MKFYSFVAPLVVVILGLGVLVFSSLLPSIKINTDNKASAGSAALHVDGTTLKLENGTRFIVKGTNLEFFRDPGCSYVTDGEYPVRAQIADKMKSIGVNAVRVNYSYSYINQNAENINKTLDVMQELANRGIYSMPSDHTYTGEKLTGSSSVYPVFKKLVDGAKARGIEDYLIMNPYNEPYSDDFQWADWEKENKATITYIRSTANFKGVIVIDNPTWSANFDNDLSSYDVIKAHDASLMGGTANIVFSNHWYPNIDINAAKNTFNKANSVPLLMGEIGQINPGSSGMDPQYVKNVFSSAISTGIPNGFNGIFAWIWAWCDENNMTADWNDFVNLSTYGKLVQDNYYSLIPDVPNIPNPPQAITPTPSSSPSPTPTLIPTNPPVPVPTNVPQPTKKPTPIPTSTPRITATPVASSTPPTGSQSGLLGSYYKDDNLQTLVKTRIDNNINFKWGLSAPISGLPRDKFSVRWTGTIYIPQSAQVGFRTIADDGVRLYVNNILVINDWDSHPADVDDGGLYLEKGYYPIKLEFRDYDWVSKIILQWQFYNSYKFQIVPSSNLFTN